MMNVYFKKYFWFIAGVIINSFGIALITKANMGTSPITSVAYVMSLKFPLTLGQFSFLMNLVFILLQIILLRRNFKPLQLLQLVVNIIFSYCIDLSMSLLSVFHFDNLISQIIALLLGCIVLGLGISIEVAPDVLMVPGEGLVRAISTVANKRFGTVKVVFDTTLVIIAVIMSFIFWGRLNGLGLGTIVSALFVGHVVNFINRRFPLLPHIRSIA